MNKHKILYKLIAMFTIVILLNAININTTKAITMNAYPMTDSNFNIWGDSVQTTFSDKGYFSVLNVNGTEANIKNWSGSLIGVSGQTKLSYISNGNYVKISFEATNTSGSTKTIGIATYADIQIADNDYDLSINKYKKTEYKSVEYPPTSEIMAQLRELELEIGEEMSKLEELLGL